MGRIVYRVKTLLYYKYNREVVIVTDFVQLNITL
jgi:hypothetical protein